MDALLQLLNEAEKGARENTVLLVEERFERRLSEEAGEIKRTIIEVKAELGKRITEVEAKLDGRITEVEAKLETKIEKMKGEIIKWMFLFWVGQVATLTAIFAFLLSR